MNRIEKAIIRKLCKTGRDMRGWNKPMESGHPYIILLVYGKIRKVHSIEYHMDGMAMIIDSINFETVKEG